MNEQQEKMIEDFRNALTDLDSVLTDLPDGSLDWRETEGQWTIREVVHHLADDCNVYTFIIERALATPDCKVFFTGFPGNQTWAERLDFHKRPVTPARALMHAHRQFLSELVGRFPERWQNKAGYYNEVGEKVAESTVTDMMTMLTTHMQDHTTMIKAIIKRNLH